MPKTGKTIQKMKVFEGSRPPGEARDEGKMAPRRAQFGPVELRLPKISTSWLKMAKMSDKMRQDGGKMRKMKDVSSVLGPSRGEDLHRPANSGAGRGPGEVPPLGRVNPTPRQLQNPYSGPFAS